MKKSKFIDSNILLRFLLRDDPKKAKACKDLFYKIERKKTPAYTTDLVIAEIIWTLKSFYGYPKEKVCSVVHIILNFPSLQISNKKILKEALFLYQNKNIDFIDAYNATYARYNKIPEIYSYDEDFDKVSGIKRLEP